MRANVSSRLSTDTPVIASLLESIRRGEIKVPQFQRPFVWKAPQAFSLLDSIANNYPIGSLLLWRTPSKLATDRNIGDFQLPVTDDLTPTDYVLDGQQRLTVIYSCLGAPATAGGFSAGYHVREDEFVELPEATDPLVLPLRAIYDTTKLLDFRTALRLQPNGPALNDALDALVRAVTNYRLPVVTLKDLTVEEVCPIFERINSSGTRLSTYDLMVAATWSVTFNLNEEAKVIRSALSRKGFGDIDGDTILKCLAAVNVGSIKNSDITGLRSIKAKSEMDTLVFRTKEAMLAAVDLLSTEFKIHSWDFLPYEALIVVLTSVFASQRTLSQAQVKRVRQWFWRSALSERYRVGGEAFVSKDIAKVKEFVVDGRGSPSAFGEVPPNTTWSKVPFRANNSRSRAFVLMLAQLGPRNITNGAAIDVTVSLSAWNKKEFHHVNPRAFLESIDDPGEHNAIGNICMLVASENKLVSDSDPKTYLPTCAGALGTQADGVFASNLLPLPSAFVYGTADYSGFLEARCVLIGDLACRLCDGDLPNAKTTLPSKIAGGDIATCSH